MTNSLSNKLTSHAVSLYTILTKLIVLLEITAVFTTVASPKLSNVTVVLAFPSIL